MVTFKRDIFFWTLLLAKLLRYTQNILFRCIFVFQEHIQVFDFSNELNERRNDYNKKIMLFFLIFQNIFGATNKKCSFPFHCGSYCNVEIEVSEIELTLFTFRKKCSNLIVNIQLLCWFANKILDLFRQTEWFHFIWSYRISNRNTEFCYFLFMNV